MNSITTASQYFLAMTSTMLLKGGKSASHQLSIFYSLGVITESDFFLLSIGQFRVGKVMFEISSD